MIPIYNREPDTDSNGAAGSRIVVDVEAEMVPRTHASIGMMFIYNLAHRSSSRGTWLGVILFGLYTRRDFWRCYQGKRGCVPRRRRLQGPYV
jgi:hypothetical protein